MADAAGGTGRRGRGFFGRPRGLATLYSREDWVSCFGAVGGCGLPAGLLLLTGAPYIGRRMGGADVRHAGHGEPGAGAGATSSAAPASP